MKKSGPQGVMVFLRVGVLIIALGGVVYSMGYLRKNPVGEILLNPDAAQTQQAPKPIGGKLDLCPTRVAEVVVQGPQQKLRFFQEGTGTNKWSLDNGQIMVLDPLMMEKWLAQYCKVQISGFLGAPKTDQAFGITVKLTFVNGGSMELKRAEKAVYLSQGELIRSEELEDAVSKLAPELVR